jgi:CheY-like chemotaxis protein
MLASVVIVHDSQDFLASAGSALRGAGYDVTCHCSPLAAIDDVENGAKIDALVTGLAFPAGSPHGISLARMLRERRRGLPVILVGNEDKFQAEAASIGELLPSRVDPIELPAAVGLAIRKALGVRGRAFC